jgi:hypothetical protein
MVLPDPTADTPCPDPSPRGAAIGRSFLLGLKNGGNWMQWMGELGKSTYNVVELRAGLSAQAAAVALGVGVVAGEVRLDVCGSLVDVACCFNHQPNSLPLSLSLSLSAHQDEAGRTLKLVLSGLRVAAGCVEVVSDTTGGAEAEGEGDS